MYLNFTVLVLTSLEHYSAVSLFLFFSPLNTLKKKNKARHSICKFLCSFIKRNNKERKIEESYNLI